MNWPNTDKLNDDELEYEEEEEEECQYIDPNDIIIIDELNWVPKPAYIEAYAKQLGFNAKEDPKELLNIAEKYLSIKLPSNIKRAFTKDSLQILYVDMTTQEIKIKTEIEEKAAEEFEQIRQQLRKGLKKNVNNIPPPIITNGKKNLNNNKNINDNKKKTEDELKKKLEEQQKFLNDEKNKNLNSKLNDSEDDKEDEKVNDSNNE